MPETPDSAPSPTAAGPHTIAALLGLALLCASGCGGGGGGGGGDGGDTTPPPSATTWNSTSLRTLAVDGLTTPWIEAALDATGRAHLAFFERASGPGAPYRISYLSLDPAAPAAAGAPEEVVRVDNCSGLSLAVDGSGKAGVLYQGGLQRPCNEEQSDAMWSVRQGDSWSERTAAVGWVERNPTLPDGLAGSNLAVTVDAQGKVHAAYQFYYEGCDAMNFRYPDLRYVRLDPGSPDDPTEETVEGNDYDQSNEQNRAGVRVSLTTDSAGNPAAFYYAETKDGTKGLRVARKISGQWERAWIEPGCEVGFISAARSPKDGSLGVAYYVIKYLDGRDDDHLLRFASETGGAWVSATVDAQTRCGDYCSLAYDAGGTPAVAYRELETHTGYALRNLKYAHRQGTSWTREVVASAGDIGLYNTLRFGPNNKTAVFTYSASESRIYLFQK